MQGMRAARATFAAAAAAVLIVAARAGGPDPSPAPVARIATDTPYWALSHVLRLDPPAAPGAVGRDREVIVDLGEVRFDASGDWAFDGQRRRLYFTHDDQARGTVVQDGGALVVGGSWAERAADGRFVVTRDDAPASAFVPDATGDVLVSTREAGDTSGEVRLDVLARRPTGPVDPTDVAGRFWFGYLETSAAEDGSVTGDAYSAFGELVLKKSGKAKVTVVSSDGAARGAGTWQVAGDEAGVLAGSLTLTFELDVGGTRTMTVLPGAGLDVLLAADRDPPPGVSAVVVAVRQGRGLSNRRISGTLVGVGLDVTPFARNVPLPAGDLDTTLDLVLDDYQVRLDFDGSRTLTVRHDRVRVVRRDRRAPAGASARLEPRRANTTAFYVLAKDGLVQALDDGIPLLGAVAPSATFSFVVDDPRDGDDFAGLELIVRPAEGVR